jgi:hypothetical protein
MNRTRSRTLATILGTATVAVALFGGATAAHAEMGEPPAQTYTDWEPGFPAGPVTSGGIPGDMKADWVLGNRVGNVSFYGPIDGMWVTGGQVDHFNDYNGRNACSATSDYAAVACVN